MIHVDHKERAGQLAHLQDAVEIALHPRHLALDGRLLLLGKLGHLAAGLHLLEMLVLGDRALDRPEIGQGPAEPAVDAIGHANARGRLAHNLLGLALRSDKEHDAAVGHEVFDKVRRLLQLNVGLAEIDDGDALAVVENVGLGTRIPALGLVPEMHARI